MVMLIRENFILTAFAASFMLALVMLALALGLIQLFSYGLPLPMPVLLVIVAVSFVLSAAFFERYEVGSMLWSLLVSLMGSLLVLLLAGGVIYSATAEGPGWGDILSGLAVCMMVSMILLNYLKQSLGQIEGY
jgi:hypothetical protein